MTLEELKAARDKIERERRESGWGIGFYDYPPDVTVEEAWRRAEQDRQWSDSPPNDWGNV